jgi:hypothetical protein
MVAGAFGFLAAAVSSWCRINCEGLHNELAQVWLALVLTSGGQCSCRREAGVCGCIYAIAIGHLLAHVKLVSMIVSCGNAVQCFY